MKYPVRAQNPYTGKLVYKSANENTRVGTVDIYSAEHSKNMSQWWTHPWRIKNNLPKLNKIYVNLENHNEKEDHFT